MESLIHEIDAEAAPGKRLVPFGVAGGNWESKEAAKYATYETADGGLPPTPLIHARNPYNREIREARAVLEVGCGVGRNLPWIMENTGARYFGVEPNPSMLRYFWECNDKDRYGSRVCLASDFDEEIRGRRYDVVLITFVFQHITYRPPAGIMNIDDITRTIMRCTADNCVWFLLEHDREDPGWIERWLGNNGIIADVYLRDWRDFDFLCHRGDHHLIIFKTNDRAGVGLP